MTQILFNLISNATKFTKKGSIILNLSWLEDHAKTSSFHGLEGVQELSEFDFTVDRKMKSHQGET
jgi:signal transduction histidine kinase